jgi:RimJ/RimL family protein N-acetyltransferase
MPSRIHLSKVTAELIESFHACVKEVAMERTYLSIVEPPSLDVLRLAINQNVVDALPLVVGVEDSKVIGWCSIVRDIRDGFAHTGVLGVGIAKAFRERGLGRHLLEETLAKASHIGIVRVELEVFASNKRAIRFYVREKFEMEGRKRQARYLDGQFDDIVCMARHI